uniref:F-box/FBD/LRR-repeat protein At1g13570-like n=1 Tax=Nicotiana tabacum TaxID=4097 RepID=A0A1S4CTV7_TOBAC|nr:PREDICTED: F-box/FBD/LRR-repeat protein At1g13570-like [Nicotiana tabacum]
MPLPDAVRTSILSRKWRYKWCRIPQLTLDRTLWKIHQISYIENIIRHILTRYGGPGKPYKLPASFFKCVHLRHLSLEDCLISHPPAFRGFERLISLKLYNVTILSTLLGSLISHCPLLEQLVLHLPDNYRGVIEINAPKLKSLDFTSRVDNSGVPIALDNLDLEGSFGDTTFNNLSIIVIRSIQGINPHMQLLKLLLAKSPALMRIIIEALTYKDYEILKSLIEHSEFSIFQNASTSTFLKHIPPQFFNMVAKSGLWDCKLVSIDGSKTAEKVL